MAPTRRSVHAKLIYPQHAYNPEDLCLFIEAEGFANDWKDLGLSEDALLKVELEIMVDPKRHPIVTGTGGLRKMRHAPRGSGKGKSGGIRIGYVYFESVHVVLLVIAYSKNEMDDIPVELKKVIKDLIERQERVFTSGVVR